jgi:hypothetical protein
MIDKQIYHDFKLWKTNHIAYDIIVKDSFSHLYSEKEKNDFISFIEKEIMKLDGDKKVLKDMYLKMYANPVISYLQTEN